MQLLHCPYCQGTDIVRHGTRLKASNDIGVARARAWTHIYTDYSYAGQSSEVKHQIIDMAMNASRIRDTTRVLHVSPTTVIKNSKERLNSTR